MKLSLLLLILVCFISCNNANTDTDKLKADNIAVVEKYVQAVQNKDVKTMSDLLAENYVGYGPGFADSIDKKGAVENFQNLVDNLYDKMTYDRSFNIAAEVTDGPQPGHFVSNWAKLTITYKDGRGPIHLYATTAYRIEDGKITHTRTIYDEADAVRQLEGSAAQSK